MSELLDLFDPDLGRVCLGAGGGSSLWRGHAISPTKDSGTAVRDLERASWPDPTDPARLEGLVERACRVREQGRAVVLDSEIGLVDGCQRLRGLAGWLEDLLSAPSFADELMERVTWTCSELLRAALRVVGHLVDAVVIYEDLAGQTRPLVSPDLYRRRIKPLHAALVETIRSHSPARIVIHCDGAIGELLWDFVDIGVDVVNPVQTSAPGMDPHSLKRSLGRHLCFWGGYDASWALAFGSPQEVEAECRRVLAALAPGGGFIFGPAHPIGSGIPPQNVVALIRAARGYRPSP